ncbi:MAG TPA: hypothetical protein VN381_07665 [Anaerovoracaceae bacterium]|nr:hypothetical protein [Anaerovoracaceae bacterium]
MEDFMVGMKIYSLDWFWKYNLDYKQAAEELKSLNIRYIITMSKHLSMYNSAVDSEIPEEKRVLMERFDDRAFRDALKEAGIGYFGACNFFFDPPAMYRHGNIPIDHTGAKAVETDWYIGGCPTNEAYVAERTEQIVDAMRALDMDGVFLGFMRYPGFWELWLPGTSEKDWPEYCFCPRCLEKFRESTDIPIPQGSFPGAWIRENAYAEWVRFKTNVIAGIVRDIRARIRDINPDAQVILNTVPFDEGHYCHNGRQIFAQDPTLLAQYVDIFEVMGYHQILKQPVSWIAQAGRYFKETTGKKVVCTVQAKPLYLEGMHAGKGRAAAITPEEFYLALKDIRQSGLDGVVVFTWSDFLEQKFIKRDTVLTDMIASITK